MTIVLGLNAFHADSSACIVRDGVLIAAAEEERFRRIKHWAGFPSEAIRYCLKEARASLADVSDIAINQDNSANFLHKIAFTLRTRPNLKLVSQKLRRRRARTGIFTNFERSFPDDKLSANLHQIEHHLSHLASAFLVSPFDEASVLSVDGFGDFASTAWGLGNGNHVAVEGRVLFPHSLGILYQSLTQFIGFPNYGDEYKVMGLAPYGKPIYLKQLRDLIKIDSKFAFELNLDYFLHHRANVEQDWSGKEPSVGTLYSQRLVELLGPPRSPAEAITRRHQDIAASVQKLYEEVFFHLLAQLYRQHKVNNLALAGGCAMNSVANGKIYSNTPFKRLYVQSAAGDAGGAIGAALVVWSRLFGESPAINCSPSTEYSICSKRPSQRFYMDHAYFGPEFSRAEIVQAIDERKHDLTPNKFIISEMLDLSELQSQVASEIAGGKVIGWFQGRMEWGPRALGNRSILGDPRRADMKDILNQKIKRRESFRPFAPSILRELATNWFEEDDNVPFMMQVFQVREEKRSQIPAVTHVDGSGRLQTVDKTTNPRYYGLIDKFRQITSIPMLLNTSFNENEPVVCTPQQALDCFLRTQMDLLVLNDFLIQRLN